MAYFHINQKQIVKIKNISGKYIKYQSIKSKKKGRYASFLPSLGASRGSDVTSRLSGLGTICLGINGELQSCWNGVWYVGSVR